jgi:hypothetical protein
VIEAGGVLIERRRQLWCGRVGCRGRDPKMSGATRRRPLIAAAPVGESRRFLAAVH